MNKQSPSSVRPWLRPLLTASAGTAILFSQTSCGVSGLLNRGKNDDADSARVASAEPKEKKRKRGSLFNRAKERNSYINDDIKTTRRDRYSNQNVVNFEPANEPAPTVAATPTPPPIHSNNYSKPTQSQAANQLQLDPDPKFNDHPQVTARTGRPEDSLRLPTLDSDFPQQTPTKTANSYPSQRPTAPRRTGNDGYMPLQPRLPSAETLQPPSE